MDIDNINAAVQRPTLLVDYKSQELYSQTSWTGTFFNYWKSNIGSSGQWVLSWYGNVETRELKERIPAYDANYLIEKLPQSFKHEDTEYFLTIEAGSEDFWQIAYKDVNDGQYYAAADATLVEVAANVASKLFSDGIINDHKED